MATIYVTAPNDRPDFRQILALLDFKHVDTDGDSYNPASRTWTWLHVQNRDEPGEVVDIYSLAESPRILVVESDYVELAAAVALYLGLFMRGEVCSTENGAYSTPDALMAMCGKYDWEAAIVRAANSPAAQSTLEFPYPALLLTTDPRELFLGKVLNFTARSLRMRPLEEFLRSLWDQLQRRRDQRPTYELFATLIERALTDPASPFDKSWKRFTKPRPVSPNFDDLEQTIRFHVAELYTMTENGQITSLRSMNNVISPSGNLWRNSDTGLFLDFAAIESSEKESTTDCNWGILAEFLELGRLSER